MVARSMWITSLLAGIMLAGLAQGAQAAQVGKAFADTMLELMKQ